MAQKIWNIIGIHHGEEFTADLTVDDDGTVVECEYPLYDLLALNWTDARSVCIQNGWHGDRFPSHVRGHSELKRRGWTDSLIRKYLPEPDGIEANPHHPGGAPMRIYRIQRVEAIEHQYQIGIPKPINA